MLTFCSRRHARFLVTMWPAMLNTLSSHGTGTDVAGIAKYFAATWESREAKIFPYRAFTALELSLDLLT